MQPHKIKTKFIEVYNGNKNIFTPNILGYGKRGDFLYELSWGDAIFPRQPIIYGVTVITLSGEKRHDLSQSFQRKADAESFITKLGKISKAESQLEELKSADTNWGAW